MNKRMTEAMYASIPELVEAGITTAEIARRFDVTEKSLRVLCSHRRISLRIGGTRHTTVRLSDHALSGLSTAARTRGMNEAQLASRLLIAIAADNLYNAVLDDQIRDWIV
jgi:hypothetical protein